MIVDDLFDEHLCYLMIYDDLLMAFDEISPDLDLPISEKSENDQHPPN